MSWVMVRVNPNPNTTNGADFAMVSILAKFGIKPISKRYRASTTNTFMIPKLNQANTILIQVGYHTDIRLIKNY